MSKLSNLNTVIHDLKSDKVKERQQGLDDLRTVFARNEVVLNFDRKGTGEAWLTIFQALFAAVGNERIAYIKKYKSTTSAAVIARRLSDAAAVVRYMVERRVERMNKAVERSLL